MGTTTNFIEKLIIRQLIIDLHAAGYAMEVHDGEAIAQSLTRNVEEVFAALFSTDEDTLRVFRNEGFRGHRQVGRVKLIYGNDGTDVIHDYTSNLQFTLRRTFALAKRIENGELNWNDKIGTEMGVQL